MRLVARPCFPGPPTRQHEVRLGGAPAQAELVQRRVDVVEGRRSQVVRVVGEVAHRELVAPRTGHLCRAQHVGRVAHRVAQEFGPVHLLCNNAGVGSGGLIVDLRLQDWEWVLGVNMWGVIHGLHAFLPGMLDHGEEGHIVNTASLAGHVSAPFMGPYGASKFAVVALSESLFHELAMTNARIGVSVLCPGWVNTNIHAGERNRPAALRGPAAFDGADPRADFLKQVLANGKSPEEVASLVFDALASDRFYVLTHPEMTSAIEVRAQAIVAGDNPRLSAVF